MNSALLLDHFHRIAGVPDAVQHLRRFILDLAIRGKLVEQDSKDEPASELIRRIHVEKARIFEERGIKRERPLPPVQPIEIPFITPPGWQWARIRQVTTDRGQKIPDQRFTYIDVTAIDKENGRVADAKVLAPERAPSRARKVVQTGDVLYSCVRPYLLNVAAIEKEIVPSPIASTAFAVLNGFGLILAKYLWIVLRSPMMVTSVEAKMRGQAYPAINDSDFAALPIPLPPLAEQHRVVAKVQELMDLCSQLEEARTEHESHLDMLAAATIRKLDGTHREHTRFFFSHFPVVANRQKHIAEIRRAILNLAVQGILVSSDEQSSPQELIAAVKKERLQLSSTSADFAKAADDFAKVEQQFQTIDASATPKITMRCACHFITKGTTPASEKLRPTGEIPFLKVYNIVNNSLEFDYKPTFIPKTVHETELRRSRAYPGDVLMNIVGPPLGKVAIVTDQYPEWNVNQAIAIFRPLSAFTTKFLMLVLASPLTIASVLKETRGVVGQDNLSLEQVRSLQIPLLPISQQNRIVAKVDELLTLCDQLEARISFDQIQEARLLESILHHALNHNNVAGELQTCNA